MTRIRTISSEVDLQKDEIKYFKYNLAFDQKAFYFDKGALNYYGSIPNQQIKNENKNQDSMYNFLKNILSKNTKKTTFISLGCGDGDVEKYILNRAHKEKYDVEYFGVDSSMNMIELAQKNLIDCKYPYQFIYADFSDEKFKNTFYNIIENGKHNKKIFAFLGGTLGNVPQNYIANTLRNMLQKGDILWLDVAVQKEITDSNANYWFKRVLKFLKDKERIDFLQYPLTKLGIPLKSGKLILKMERENSIKTLLFKFAFQLEHNIEFKINNEPMTLLQGDAIELITLRVYELESLKYFFEERGFKIIDYMILDNDVLQIAFKKL